jgi:hypothetical protein
MRLPFTKKKEPAVLRKKVQKRRLTPLQVQGLIGLSIAITIALLCTAVYYFTRIDSFQITQIDVVGGETIPHDTIKKSVDESLTGSYFKLVPKRFRPLYPHDVIVAHIKENNRIKNVHVEVKDNTILIAFDEYTPFALWCAHKEDISCLFIDAQGFAFAQAPELQGNAFVRFVEDGKEPVLKTNAFDATFIRNIDDFITMLEEGLSLYVTHVVKQGVFDIEFTLGGGGVLKVSQMEPLTVTFTNLQTILNSEEFIHLEPGTFQYIDLRFGDKVFVNEAPLQTGTTTASSSVEQAG